MTSDPASSGADASVGPQRSRWAAAAILAAATLAGHGWSLGDGLFFDDHLHLKHIKEMGWSFSDLLDITTIEPVDFIETWWQEKPVRWQYPRPVSVLLVRAVYELSGGSPAAQHAVSLLLHLATAYMVFRLCLLLSRSWNWSLVGGLLFVVYSHSIFAVSWIAAQNCVLQTCLMLAALLCYLRATRLEIGPNPARPAADPPAAVPPVARPALAATFVLWVLALFSRENAIMLPAVAVAFDWAFGGARWFKARFGVYLLFAAVGAAFIYWRLVHYYHPIPEIYFRKPGGDGYALWALAKLMHYLTASVWLSPMTIGPTGRYQPFSEVPGDCLLMAGILAVMGYGYWRACRHIRGWWIWPAWLVLALLPVVPVLATPHAGYSSGVGFAVAMVLGPAVAAGTGLSGHARWSRRVAVWFLIATSTYIPIYRGLWASFRAAERCTIAQMTADPAPARVSDIFFLNLPLANIYAKLCLEEEWGAPVAAARFHVLTYAPADVLRMSLPCRLEQTDERSFELSVAPGDAPYFSGLLGRFLVDAMRKNGRFQAGQMYPADGEKRPFGVTILEADSEGVRKLGFRFLRPLSDPAYRFYMASPGCPAAAIRFPAAGNGPEPGPRPALATGDTGGYSVAFAARRLQSGEAVAAEVLFGVLQSGPPAQRREAWAELGPPAKAIADAVGAPVRELVTAEAPAPADAAKIREWWSRNVDDLTLKDLWLRRDEWAALCGTRDALLAIRALASSIIRTDLYMTGPPYPGPR